MRTEKANEISYSLLKICGINNILIERDGEQSESEDHHRNSNTDIEIASAIFSRAKEHQSQASDNWLNNRICTVGLGSSTTLTLAAITNHGKAERVLAERKKKKEEARHLDMNIQISVSLWQLGKDGKLNQVSQLRILVAKSLTIWICRLCWHSMSRHSLLRRQPKQFSIPCSWTSSLVLVENIRIRAS